MQKFIGKIMLKEIAIEFVFCVGIVSGVAALLWFFC